jgi:uncharacterized membrane protein
VQSWVCLSRVLKGLRTVLELMATWMLKTLTSKTAMTLRMVMMRRAARSRTSIVPMLLLLRRLLVLLLAPVGVDLVVAEIVALEVVAAVVVAAVVLVVVPVPVHLRVAEEIGSSMCLNYLEGRAEARPFGLGGGMR